MSSSHRPTVLIADDQADVLESLRLLLKPEGVGVVAVRSPEAVLAAVEERDFDVALIDLNYARDTTSGAEGLELLAQLHSLDSTMPVVVMTAWASVELAVRAVQSGARDFVEKPWDNERLLSILRTQISLAEALRHGQRVEAENRVLRGSGGPTLIATSESMQPILELIQKVGPSEANILVTGEHGTGKDVVARQLHAVSGRAQRPLVTVNVGGLPDGVFASEIFGHVRGAFTDAREERIGRFEMADGGTLFLDEIANVPLEQQAKLLRTIESGELERVGSSKTRTVDVRIISATNADLKAMCGTGRFREDLLFRLNTVEIHLPPLRKRREDISLLAMHFLGAFSRKYERSTSRIDRAAMSILEAHPWPGNVRELSHVIERAVLVCSNEVIRAVDLGLAPATGAPRVEEMSLEELERLFITRALRRHDGNVSHTARALGLSRSALYRRLEKHGL